MNVRKKGTLYNNIYMLKLIFRITPFRVILEFVFQLIGFAEWTFFTVIFMKYLFGAEEIQRSFEDIALFLIIVTAAVMLISIAESWFYNIYSVKADQKIYFEMNRMLFEKAASVDISCYEDADFYDTYTKATSEANSRAMSVLRNVCTLAGSVCSSAYVIYTIFSINIIAGFFTFLPVTGNLIFGRIINKTVYQKDMDNVPHNRRINYVNRIVYLQQYAKEIRLTKVFGILKKTYNKAYDGINGNTDKYFRKLFTLDSISHILCFPLVFEGLWLYAAYSAMVTKTILIGDFVILSSAIVSTTWMLIDMSGSLIECYRNSSYINNLHAFMNYTPKIDENAQGLHIPDTSDIVLTLKDVSFRYTGQTEYSLKDINITVKSGEKIALVGHNGAGKTTLVKLIMRLYDPTDGTIFLNGTDIREYNVKEYRKIIGTVFQDFQIFSMSVAENVLMSSVADESDTEKSVRALKQSGAYDKIMTLDKKEHSVLTREFDDNGTVLSGGEYQKIAVARAFAKENQIIILDEPSSALDPVAEYQMYETIMKLYGEEENKNKMAFIISHRLSSATTADYIYMFEHGRIIEKGTHASLMNDRGVYCDMFTRQAESYLTEIL